jgi:succinate dehydrogenase / fumarate reductase, cytochrome b subunit
MRERPLSPHASIYRYMHTMVFSFMHRISGVWMVLGVGALVYWLMSAAAGEAEFGRANALLGGVLCRALLLAWLAAYCYHFVNGLRHLGWDAGYGLGKLQARRSARVVLGVAVVGLAVAAYLLFCPRAGAL